MLFRKLAAQRNVERLIRCGVGLREHSWLAPASSFDGLETAISAWLRQVVAEMRRPYGIDQVVVALACRDSSGRTLCTNSFGVVRPSVFYTDEGPDRLRSFFSDATVVADRDAREIVVALLSLGEIAYALAGGPTSR